MLGSRLAERYGAMADTFQASEVDVVCFQEVFTYYHLRLLTRAMPAFRHINYRPSLIGPAGGLATLSRLPGTRREYHRFPTPRAAPGLPRFTRSKATLKGTLVTRLAQPRLVVVNTHPMANLDGDWSAANRFYPVHRDQLAALTHIVEAIAEPSIVCGDFNITRDSALHRDFRRNTGLVDAFDGQCPPTFHAEYLGPGKSPQCIDFILTTPSVKVESTTMLFTEKKTLAGGPAYVSDHVGLGAVVTVPGHARFDRVHDSTDPRPSGRPAEDGV